MKVWVTIHSLSLGILEGEGDMPAHSNHPIVFLRGGRGQYMGREDRDWHRTLEAAQLRAEEMRQARIASLLKQVKRLEGLKIQVLP